MKVDINQISLENAVEIVKWKSDPVLSDQIMSDYKIVTLAEVESWIKKNSCDPNQILNGIFLDLDGKKIIIGVIRLMFINYESLNAELGIYIGESKFQGLGLGKEALLLIVNLAFRKLKLRKIYLKVNTVNKRAIKLYKNIGFIEEGVLREHYFNRLSVKYEDVVYLAIFNKVH